MSKYEQEDRAIMLEGLIAYSTKYVWENMVEPNDDFLVRIYWRNLFFDTLKKYCSDLNVKLPKKKLSIKKVQEWINSI